tara:strand:+ start:343 stop:477 length:135 start_codon:yes stop_codon:yes gene_type:complete
MENNFRVNYAVVSSSPIREIIFEIFLLFLFFSGKKKIEIEKVLC